MDKILEKFGGYLIDKYKGKTMFGLPVMNYVFRFENGYGAWMEIWDNFSIFSLEGAGMIMFPNGGDKFEFAKTIHEEEGLLYRITNNIDAACEWLQTVKDL